MRHRRSIRDKRILELIEEAFHLLRTAPAGVTVSYLIGVVPFGLGLLFFWTDMSRGAFAHERCVEEALALALLYLWMKGWQAVFAAQLRARVAGVEPPAWTFGRIARLAGLQAVPHPYAFLALPAAALMLIPFGWVYAFFQNLTCLADGEESDLHRLMRRGWRQACLWPAQNHGLILIFAGFGFFVFVNVMVTLLLAPHLLRMFTGVETIFTLSGTHALNTTLFAAACVVTWICMKPLVQAVYVLRCFYGESLQSGADLRADLARIEREGGR